VLAEDETDILLFPLTRAGWAIRGSQTKVPISGKNDKRTLFGVINIRTGNRLYLERRYQKGEDFRMFLRHVRAHFRSQPIMMLLDEDSSHTAKVSIALADKLQIHMLFLPKRSPKLNPMDHLWRSVKKEISSLHQYHDINEHLLYFLEYLEQMSNEEALRKAGVLSAKFWIDL
jgi:transposase